MRHDQEQIFGRDEGDAWYRRNADWLARKVDADPVLALLGTLDPARLLTIRSVCDVGCSDGWRLRALRPVLAPGVELNGFDASELAIEAGRRLVRDVDLKWGLVDTPPFKRDFDLVIVSFVLHWVSRSRLSRAIAAIDGLVAEGGLLVIGDFLPDRPCRRRYHHRDDVELFTYKQDYVAAFTSLALYRELVRISCPHDRLSVGAAPAADQDRAVYAVLHKTPDAYVLP